ncbi:MAG: hypothetical protein GC191_13515 [Azospirillum sp.]|nr:hypothetical protein [Azospirillum sp.]
MGGPHPAIGRLWPLVVVLLLAIGAGTAVALADDTPTHRFTANMGELRTTLKAFSDTVDSYNRSIKEITDFDLAAAKHQVEEIRDQIKRIIDQIGYGSELAQSQDELSRWIDRNRRLVRADPLLSRERKAYLEDQWSRRSDEVERAGRETAAIRKDLADQLNLVVGDENFLTQLMFLEKAGEASALVRKFLEDIKAFSDDLKKRLEQLPKLGPVS